MIILVISLFGWLFTNEVEVKYVTVKYAKSTEITSVIGNDINIPRISKWNNDDFIVVEFFTETDLLKLSKKVKGFKRFDIYFCDQPKGIDRLALLDIYSGGDNLSNMSFNSNLKLRRDKKSKLYKYNLILFIVWDRQWELPSTYQKSSGRKYYLKHDLRAKPEDVCVSFVSWDLFVQTLKSQEIRITKSDLRKVVEGGTISKVLHPRR